MTIIEILSSIVAIGITVAISVKTYKSWKK